jgi:hypothetical protein
MIGEQMDPLGSAPRSQMSEAVSVGQSRKGPNLKAQGRLCNRIVSCLEVNNTDEDFSKIMQQIEKMKIAGADELSPIELKYKKFSAIAKGGVRVRKSVAGAVRDCIKLLRAEKQVLEKMRDSDSDSDTDSAIGPDPGEVAEQMASEMDLKLEEAGEPIDKRLIKGFERAGEEKGSNIAKRILEGRSGGVRSFEKANADSESINRVLDRFDEKNPSIRDGYINHLRTEIQEGCSEGGEGLIGACLALSCLTDTYKAEGDGSIKIPEEDRHCFQLVGDKMRLEMKELTNSKDEEIKDLEAVVANATKLFPKSGSKARIEDLKQEKKDLIEAKKASIENQFGGKPVVMELARFSSTLSCDKTSNSGLKATFDVWEKQVNEGVIDLPSGETKVAGMGKALSDLWRQATTYDSINFCNPDGSVDSSFSSADVSESDDRGALVRKVLTAYSERGREAGKAGCTVDIPEVIEHNGILQNLTNESLGELSNETERFVRSWAQEAFNDVQGCIAPFTSSGNDPGDIFLRATGSPLNLVRNFNADGTSTNSIDIDFAINYRSHMCKEYAFREDLGRKQGRPVPVGNVRVSIQIQYDDSGKPVNMQLIPKDLEMAAPVPPEDLHQYSDEHKEEQLKIREDEIKTLG